MRVAKYYYQMEGINYRVGWSKLFPLHNKLFVVSSSPN